MNKNLLGICLGLLFLSGPVFSQERSVMGKVMSSDDGTPIPGVNVLIKGSGAGTTTDADGNYRIGISDDNATLVFSFVGYKTTEIFVGTKTVIDVQL